MVLKMKGRRNMKPQQIRDPRERFNNAWSKLNFWQRAIITIRICYHVALYWVRHLKPIDVIFSACLAELALFILAVWLPFEQAMTNIGIGNFVIAGFVLLPSVFDRRRKQHANFLNERRSRRS